MRTARSRCDKIAKITNAYNTDEETISFNGQKTYADQSGANPLVKDKFTFQLEALGGMKNEIARAEWSHRFRQARHLLQRRCQQGPHA